MIKYRETPEVESINSVEQRPSEKASGFKLIKTCFTCYGIRKFITIIPH
jgi:hypothetical protein